MEPIATPQTTATFTGRQAFTEYYQRLGEELRPDDSYYAFAFFREYQALWVRELFRSFHLRLAGKNIDDRAIFNEDMRAVVGRIYRDNPNLKAKFKDVDLPVGLVVTSDRLIQLAAEPEPFLVEIKNGPLFGYYRQFFLQNWNANEALQLVKEVAAKFDLEPDMARLRRADNERDNAQALETTRQIEAIEDSWAYDFAGKERDYGQKVRGEPIRLWSVPRTTAEFLEYFVVATNSRRILEVGTSAGYSTLYLAMGATYTNGKVTTIEKLDLKVQLARENFARSGLSNIKLIQKDATETLSAKEPENLDMVFLDADKENYGRYLDLIVPKLRVGGFIVADNVFDYGHMMKEYLDKVLGTKLPGSQTDRRVRSYTLPVDNGVLITQKIQD